MKGRGKAKGASCCQEASHECVKKGRTFMPGWQRVRQHRQRAAHR